MPASLSKSSKLPTWLTRERVAAAAMVGFVLLAYGSLLGWDPAEGLTNPPEGVEDFLFEPEAGSPLLVFGVSAWLVWRRRGALSRGLGLPAFWPAALLIPLALGLGFWGHYVGAPDLRVLSLAFLLPGFGAFACGRPGFRAMLLPGVMLLFAVPIPAVLVNQFMYPLQLWTGEFTYWLLQVIRVPATLQADQILASQKIFQVIESCSGLRLMETLTMAALVYCELLDRRPLHTVILVLLAPVLGTIVNGVRVLTIVLNPYSEFSSIHTTQGIAMLLIGVLVLAAVDLVLEPLLARVPRWRRAGRAPVPHEDAAAVLPRRRLALLATALVVLAAGSFLLPPWEWTGQGMRTLSDMPVRLGDWRSAPIKIDNTFLGSVGFRERAWRNYRQGEVEVHVFVGVDDRLERRRSLFSEKTRLPGTGWWIQHRIAVKTTDDFAGELLLVRSRTGEKLVLHWYEGVDSPWNETLRAFFAADRGPLRRPGVARVVRISTPVESSTGGLEEAEGRLRAFYPAVREILEALGRGERPAVAGVAAPAPPPRQDG